MPLRIKPFYKLERAVKALYMPYIDPTTYLEHYQHARGAAAAVAWCTAAAAAAAARVGALLLLSLLHCMGLWDTQATSDI
jgi:hypothetical protein